MARIIGLLLVVILVAGCGERLESTYYSYSPTWTRGGAILFIRGLETVRKNTLNSQLGSTYAESLLTMDAAGDNETTAVADVTDNTPVAISCSPARDYVAYLGDLRSGSYGKIIIRSLATSASTSLGLAEMNFDPRIKSFDWSADGNQFVYCTTNEVRIRAWNGYGDGTDSLVTAESNLTFVSWKYGDRIAYVKTSGDDKILSLIYPDGGTRETFAAGASVDLPQISPTNSNDVYGIFGGSYCSVDTSAASPTTTEVLSDFSGLIPRLSPDGTKVAYSKSGASSGVYVLTIADESEVKIK
ncbi:MAG: hypothetical protein ABH823_04760 [bacterium]